MNLLLQILKFIRANTKKHCRKKRGKKNRLDYLIIAEDIISQWDVEHKNKNSIE
jgi:hypothetical protein